MGRPIDEVQKEWGKPVFLKLEKPLRDHLDAMAEREYCSIIDVIRRWIIDDMKIRAERVADANWLIGEIQAKEECLDAAGESVPLA